MEHFTPLASTLGGVLIGISASLLLLFNGRIAGISGIFSGLLLPRPADRADAQELGWRAAFVGGLVVGGAVMFALQPQLFAVTYDRSLLTIAVAGLVVGFGVRLGSGCTSGHGVCGISRFSRRSIVATVTFIATGALTVLAVRLLGGVS
ncbi:MAG: YeeE/YedE family protein [Myxococcota bacterium]|nr:YeeE/YedE family protein [Myxococcota bacterium]